MSLKQRYAIAQNEFQRSTVRRERATALHELLQNPTISEWIGIIAQMQTMSDGKGAVAIRPLGTTDISIKTWNNSFSDVNSGTLIAPGTALYERIADLAVGDTVIFSGSFLTGETDYLKESSLTEHGAMESPEFIFQFTDVRKFQYGNQSADPGR